MRREAASTCGMWSEAPSYLGSQFTSIQLGRFEEAPFATLILFVTCFTFSFFTTVAVVSHGDCSSCSGF